MRALVHSTISGDSRESPMRRAFRKSSLLSTLLGAALLSGCGESSQLTWLKDLSAPIIWGGLRLAVCAGLLGLLIALLARRLVRGRKTRLAPRSIVRRVAGFSASVALLLLFPAGLAYIGFFEGALKASIFELSEGDFAREYFPAIGSGGADLVGVLLLTNTSSTPEETAALREEFRKGEREIDPTQISATLAALEGAFIRDASKEIKSDLEKRLPALASGGGKHALDWFMDNFSEALLRAAVQEDLERQGLASILDLFGAMVRKLPEAATRDGIPETLSHQDTSTFLVEVAIADGVVKFLIRPFCRAHQIGSFFPTLLIFCLSLIVMRQSTESQYPSVFNEGSYTSDGTTDEGSFSPNPTTPDGPSPPLRGSNGR